MGSTSREERQEKYPCKNRAYKTRKKKEGRRKDEEDETIRVDNPVSLSTPPTDDDRLVFHQLYTILLSCPKCFRGKEKER